MWGSVTSGLGADPNRILTGQELAMQRHAGTAIIAAIFTLIIASSASSSPEWANTHKHPEYPPHSYLTSVGTSSNSIEEAKDGARLDMAKQVRVQIKGEFLIEKMSTRIAENSYYRENINSRTESFVNEKLEGVQIVETSEEDGIFYALAVLDRARAGNELRSDIEHATMSVDRLLENADRLYESGSISGTLADLAQAYSISYDITLKRSLHQIISPRSSVIPGETKATPPMILSRIRDVLSRLRLVHISGDGQIGRIGDQLPDTLAAKLSIVTEDDKMMPVNGMEVEFKFSPGEPIGRRITDDSGKTSMIVTVRRPIEHDTDTQAVLATLALGRLPGELEGTLPMVYTVFHYGIDRQSYPVQLSIVAEDGRSLPRLESRIVRALNKLGYTVEKDVLASLVGKLATVDVKEMGGLRGSQKLVSVELDLSVLDAKEGAVLDSTSFSGKGLGKSEEEAFQKGASAVKIDDKKLSVLLKTGKQVFMKARERRSKDRFEEGEELFNAKKYGAALRRLDRVPVGTEFYPEAQKLVQEIMASRPPAPSPSIAILEPRCDGSRRQTELAKTLTAMITKAFIGNRELRTMEREKIEEVVKEIELSSGKYIDQGSAAQFGKVTGANALLLSSLKMVGEDVELDARLIETETGEFLAAATARGSSERIRNIAEDIVNEIVDSLDETPFVGMP